MRYEPDWGRKPLRSGGIKSVTIDRERNVLSLVVGTSAGQPETAEFPGEKLTAIQYYENYPWQPVWDYFGHTYQLRVTCTAASGRTSRRVFLLPGPLAAEQQNEFAAFAAANAAAFDAEIHQDPGSVIAVVLFLVYFVMSFWRQW